MKIKFYIIILFVLIVIIPSFSSEIDDLNELALTKFNTGDFNGAAELFQKCLKIDPVDSNIHFNLGCCYRKMHLYELSVYEFSLSLEVEPNDDEIKNRIDSTANEGIVYLKDKVKENAINVNLKNSLVYLYIIKKEYDNAYNLLSDVLNINPENPKSNYLLSLYYYKKGEITLALEPAQKSVKLENNNIKYKRNLKFIENLLPVNYKSKITLLPKNKVSDYELAVSLYDQGKHAEAAACLLDHLQTNPRDEKSHRLMRKILLYASLGINRIIEK